MLIMFAEFTGEFFTPEERRYLECRRKWGLLDSFQWMRIKFKMKYIHYEKGREKYIIFGKLRKNVIEWLNINGCKVKRYTKPTGVFYYYIYF